MYLSAVHHFHIQADYADPLQMTPRWQLVLHGIQRLQKASHKRLLLVPDHVASLQEFEDVKMPMASPVPNR